MAQVIPWAEPQPPGEVELHHRMAEEGLSPYAWSNGPGFSYGAHEHAYHKVLYVVRGSIVFHLPDQGESLDLVAGDRLELPPGVLHSARVGPSGVVCLEARRPDRG
jgi:mannose-6-phosphate isomerase-like protein (cupin superfamily)